MLANEPSVGLFYVQQHVQKAVPNVINLKVCLAFQRPLEHSCRAYCDTLQYLFTRQMTDETVVDGKPHRSEEVLAIL